MLIRRVVDDELDDDLHLAVVGCVQEAPEVVERAVARMDIPVIRDVVPVVAQGRGEEWQQPQTGDPERLQVVELSHEPLEIADPVVIAVGERLHVELVDDRVLVPEGVSGAASPLHG